MGKSRMGRREVTISVELGVKDEHSGSAVFDDKFKLRPSQSPVKGNKNGADL